LEVLASFSSIPYH